MDSHNILGGTEEEFSSSESGWTAYIESPIPENLSSDEQEDVYNIKNKCSVDNYNEDRDQEESDDSMASDASSGPNHHKLSCKNSNPSHGGRDRHQQAATKYSSEEKLHKQVIKDQRRSQTEKMSLVKAKSAASHVSKWSKGEDEPVEKPFQYLHSPQFPL